MDCRDTITNGSSFIEMLEDQFANKRKVNILFDDNGLTRTEGYIQALKSEHPASIVMDNKMVVLLEKVVAVNGVFSPDFSEC